MNHTDHQRHHFAEGLRILAATLDADPDMPLPYSDMAFFCTTREQFHTAVRLLDDEPRIAHEPEQKHYDFVARGSIAGLEVTVYGRAHVVADKVVVGQETVDKVEWRLPKDLGTRAQHDRLLAAVEASPEAGAR